jgi:hypothetical protein
LNLHDCRIAAQFTIRHRDRDLQHRRRRRTAVLCLIDFSASDTPRVARFR